MMSSGCRDVSCRQSPDVLQSIPLFAGLPDNLIRSIELQVHVRPRNEMIFSEGDITMHAHFAVTDMAVMGANYLENGLEGIFRIFKTGDLVGNPDVFDEEAKEPYSAVMRRKGILATIPKQQLRTLLQQHPLLLLRFMQGIVLPNEAYCMHRRSWSNGAKYQENTSKNKVLAVLAYLLQNGYAVQDDTGAYILEMTQEEIGALIDHTREATSRTLKVLRESGVIIQWPRGASYRYSGAMIPQDAASAIIAYCKQKQ